MLDRKSKIFLKFLDKKAGKEISYADEIDYPADLGNEADLSALIRYLEAEGYVEIIKAANTGSRLGVCLSHKGRNRKAFAMQEVLRYLGEKWIDFFALLTALGALVISIVALLR